MAGAVGKGMLYIVKDLGLREPYRGSVPLVSGELGEDFTYYFTASEQVPSAVAVGVLVDRDGSVSVSGGFILQVLPGADDQLVSRLEERLAALTSVTDRIQSGATPEDLLREVIGEDVQVLQRQPVAFQCTCSPGRIRSLLKSLGKEELSDILEKQGKAEVICHFCNERYVVEKEELERWLGEAD